VLLARIHPFIQQHLCDPELSPGEIAAAHDIFPRLLHKLFQEQGEIVAGWSRARRPEGCRRDLFDSAQAARPAAAAARWVPQRDPFRPRVRAAYGVAPHDHRLSYNGPRTPVA
jgi:hypothetical protein